MIKSKSLITEFSRNTTIDLFMGRARAFSNGQRATPFDLPANSRERHAFYRKLVGFSPAQLNSYWSRLTFSGRTLPPYQLPSEDRIVDMVCKNPAAIAYVSSKPTSDCVKVLIEVDASIN